MTYQEIQRFADFIRAKLNILDDMNGFTFEGRKYPIEIEDECKSLKDFLFKNTEVVYKVGSDGKYQACCIHSKMEDMDVYVNTYTGMIEVFKGRLGADTPMDGLLIKNIDNLFRKEFERTIERRCSA